LKVVLFVCFSSEIFTEGNEGNSERLREQAKVLAKKSNSAASSLSSFPSVKFSAENFVSASRRNQLAGRVRSPENVAQRLALGETGAK
jgi:hypothetical protein